MAGNEVYEKTKTEQNSKFAIKKNIIWNETKKLSNLGELGYSLFDLSPMGFSYYRLISNILIITI